MSPNAQSTLPSLGEKPRRSVLLVEDEVLIRMSTSEVLRDHGFEVEEAASGAEARAGMAAGGIGAVVIDIGLPDQRGDDLAMEFRKADAGLAIVIASGGHGDTAREHFAGDPMTTFADKPYNMDGLAVMLRKLRPDL